MKRLKQLLVIGLSLVMVFMFAACDSCSDDTQGVTLASISVDSSAAQTEFYVYEDFSSDGIAVTATYSDGSTATLTSDQYTVDSSAYNKASRGTYAITVSYEGQTATYDVTNAYGTLSSFAIDTSSVKTLYYLGNSLDTTGLTATAVINGDTLDVTSYVSVDASTYVSSTAGDYSINVLLYYGSSYKSGTYSVTVTDQVPMAGLDIIVDDAVTTELDVPITGESVTLSTDLISGVQLHEILYGQGTVTTALSSSDYTIEFYKETADGVAQISGSDLAVSSGTYQLWVKYNYTDPAYGTVYTLSSFVLITIVNPVTAIVLDGTNASAVYTQSAGSDKISSTWTYTVTYSNGATATVSADDVTVTIDTITEGENKTATVSYTEAGATVTCDVTYTVTAAEAGSQHYTINLNSLTATPTAGTALIEGVLYTIGSPAYGTNSRTHDDLSEETINGRLQINAADNGFKITVTSAATITVYAQSSSSSDARAIAIYDYTSDTKGDMVGSSASVGISTSSNALDKCVFTTTDAGTYCLFTTGSSVNVFYIIIEY